MSGDGITADEKGKIKIFAAYLHATHGAERDTLAAGFRAQPNRGKGIPPSSAMSVRSL